MLLVSARLAFYTYTEWLTPAMRGDGGEWYKKEKAFLIYLLTKEQIIPSTLLRRHSTSSSSSSSSSSSEKRWRREKTLGREIQVGNPSAVWIAFPRGRRRRRRRTMFFCMFELLLLERVTSRSVGGIRRRQRRSLLFIHSWCVLCARCGGKPCWRKKDPSYSTLVKQTRAGLQLQTFSMDAATAPLLFSCFSFLFQISKKKMFFFFFFLFWNRIEIRHFSSAMKRLHVFLPPQNDDELDGVSTS